MDSTHRSVVADDVLAPPAATPTTAPTTKTASKSSGKANRLYQVIWRWHFWTGLIVTPVLIFVSIAGALYTFQEEMMPLVYPNALYVAESGTTPLPFTELYALATAAYPDTEIYAAAKEENPNRTVEFYTYGPGEEEYSTLYMNPYTGDIQETLGEDNNVFSTILDAHRTLFLGDFGRLFVELCTAWGIVSLVTGLYLWIPKKWNQVWGVWLPRLKGSRRVILRDLHTVPGLWLSAFALIVMGTGMFFTFGTGQIWLIGGALGGGFPEAYVTPPNSTVIEGATPLTIDEAIAVYQANNGTDAYTVNFPEATDDAYLFSAYLSDQPWRGRYVYIDQYSGELLTNLSWSTISLYTKLYLLSYPLHTGELFGLWTKVIAFLATLLVIFMSLSGVLMWWWRRPVGHFGAPKAAPGTPIPMFIVALTIILAVIMPTMGLTLILLFVGDWVVRFVKGFMEKRNAAG